MDYLYVNEPCITKEDYNGIHSIRIADDMFSKREIICANEIDTTTVNSLISQILYLAHEDPEQPITMYINSPGGSVSDGLALIDFMNCISAPITTVCVGLAASMGALIFACGTHGQRKMLPHARIMIHDPLVSSIGGSALQVRSASDDLMRTREIVNQILADHTGRTLEEIEEKTCQDTFFYADEAIEFGLADNIIDHI